MVNNEIKAETAAAQECRVIGVSKTSALFMFEKSLLFQYEINQILSLLDNILGGGGHTSTHAQTEC